MAAACTPRRGKSGHLGAARRVQTRGRRSQERRHGKCHRKQTAHPSGRVRVKWRGKSSPPASQEAGQDKPRAVQDITGMTARPGRPASAGHIPGNSRTPLRRRLRCPHRGREMATRAPARTESGLRSPALPTPPVRAVLTLDLRRDLPYFALLSTTRLSFESQHLQPHPDRAGALGTGSDVDRVSRP